MTSDCDRFDRHVHYLLMACRMLTAGGDEHMLAKQIDPTGLRNVFSACVSQMRTARDMRSWIKGERREDIELLYQAPPPTEAIFDKIFERFDKGPDRYKRYIRYLLTGCDTLTSGGGVPSLAARLEMKPWEMKGTLSPAHHILAAAGQIHVCLFPATSNK